MVRRYVPERGDLVWLPFSPQVGREQAGRHPALVLSPRRYNDRSGLMLACPVTSRVKGYPFEVAMDEIAGLTGAILVDHLRSLDWRERKTQHAGSAPQSVLDAVLARLQPLIGL